MEFFRINHKDERCAARTGTLSLNHGTVETPVFMPVGTNATVKAIWNHDLEEIGYNLILSNTYHLYLRPGIEVIKQIGGLHTFMNWNRNILTDSGGFQIYSLSPFRKVEEEGVWFRSHIDGSEHTLSPESIVDIQAALGSDILMPLDVCTPAGIDKKEALRALELTTLWAGRSLTAWRNSETATGRLFGIIQGNFFKHLRRQSAEQILALDLPGYAIGGLSVGESFPLFQEHLSYSADLIPERCPRYLMGIGTPPYILEAVQNGIDLFDCVFPTRTARNAQAFTANGPLSLKNLLNRYCRDPIDTECSCKVCRSYSRAYLRHLYKANEILASMLTTYHNLYYIQKLIESIRTAIQENRFTEYKSNFLRRYQPERDDKNFE